MKLFTPKIAQEVHGSKRDEDIAQIAYLTLTLKKLQDSINLENTNFNERMKEQRAVYSEEKEKLQAQLRELTKEISQKERRLKELLLPIDGIKQQAEETLARTKQEAKSILAKEEEIAEVQEFIKDKLDELSEREIQISENELKIETRLKGIQQETEMIARSHKRLNEELQAFNTEKTAKEKFFAEQERSIMILQKRNQEYIDGRTKELNEQERALKDKREALDRAFEELRRLQTNK